MLEMQGFDRKSVESRWLRRIQSGTVKTELDLFLLGYDIMRMHFPNISVNKTGKHRLGLGTDGDLALFYEDFPKSHSDNIYIWADRGYAKESLILPRDYTDYPHAVVEPQLILDDYNSLWFQRRFSEDALEAYIDLSEDDVKNTVATIWRGHENTHP